VTLKEVSGTKSPEEAERWLKRFNFGAAVLPHLWFFFHGRIGFGVFMMFVVFGMWVARRVVFSPTNDFTFYLALLYQFGVILLAIYLGYRGNRIAWDYGRRRGHDFTRIEQRQGYWGIAGLIAFFVPGIYFALLMDLG